MDRRNEMFRNLINSQKRGSKRLYEMNEFLFEKDQSFILWLTGISLSAIGLIIVNFTTLLQSISYWGIGAVVLLFCICIISGMQLRIGSFNVFGIHIQAEILLDEMLGNELYKSDQIFNIDDCSYNELLLASIEMGMNKNNSEVLFMLNSYDGLDTAGKEKELNNLKKWFKDNWKMVHTENSSYIDSRMNNTREIVYGKSKVDKLNFPKVYAKTKMLIAVWRFLFYNSFQSAILLVVVLFARELYRMK